MVIIPQDPLRDNTKDGRKTIRLRFLLRRTGPEGEGKRANRRKVKER